MPLSSGIAISAGPDIQVGATFHQKSHRNRLAQPKQSSRAVISKAPSKRKHSRAVISMHRHLESELEQRFRRTVASKASSSSDFDAQWPRQRPRALISMHSGLESELEQRFRTPFRCTVASKASSSSDFDAPWRRKRPRALMSMHSGFESELEQRFRAPSWPRNENARFLRRFGAHEAPKVPSARWRRTRI